MTKKPFPGRPYAEVDDPGFAKELARMRRTPSVEDTDIDLIVQTELERLRRLRWETEAEEYTDALRRARLAEAKYKAAQSLDRLERNDMARRLERKIRDQERAWLREHGHHVPKK
jgi:hypothetical protein